MGKYFVTLATKSRNYKVCREDIKRVHSFKFKQTPKVPKYHKEEDEMTNDEDSLVQFEPIQFFPTLTSMQRENAYEEESIMWRA